MIKSVMIIPVIKVIHRFKDLNSKSVLPPLYRGIRSIVTRPADRVNVTIRIVLALCLR